jgi:hypothetical protein
MDFEAKAREVCGTLGASSPRPEAVALVADALRAAAVDDDARREARAALQALLEEVKARAVSPPAPKWGPATQGPPEVPQTTQDPALGQAVSWGIVHHANPAVDVEAVAQAARTHGTTFDGRTHEQAFLESLAAYQSVRPSALPHDWQATFSPSAMASLLRRLLWILGLSRGERRFVTALAEDASDTVTAEVYADFLEENGRTAEGAGVRRLAPQDGDVLVITAPSGASDAASRRRWAAHAADLRAKLLASGRDARVLVLPCGSGAENLDLDAMRAAGWVRAEAVRSAANRVGADCEGHPHPRFREGAGNALARVLAALGDAP